MTWMRKLLLMLVAALAAGCAGNPFSSYNVQPGMPRDAVIQKMGTPYRVVRLPAGERLQYTAQPFGQYAWMVDLDATGRVVQARQVLTENNFNRIEPGKWTRDDIEREFGRPAWVDGVASWKGPIMTYRWRDLGGADMFYWVYLDERNVVQRAHPGMEFLNAPDDRK
jgi:hypothetical protein